MVKKYVHEDEASREIIGAAIEVHKQLGPGLLESVYEDCTEHEFILRNMPYERQKQIPIIYKGTPVGHGLRLDFLVSGLVVVELKAVEVLTPVHTAQMITYLKLTGCKLGLILNFNVPVMRDGIKRIARNL